MDRRKSSLRYRPPSRYGREPTPRLVRPLALLLKAEDLLRNQAEESEVRDALAALPAGIWGASEQHVRAGWCWLEVHEPEWAIVQFDLALDAQPDSAEAYHGKGCALIERGDVGRAIDCWLKTRRIDLLAPRVEWTLSPEAFEATCDDALAELPAAIRDRLVNVPIFHADYPDESHVKEGLDPRALGLFSGLPLPQKSVMGDGGPALDAVFLFQRNIERIASDPEHARDEIRITLIHETGHFFGLEDEDLEQMGLG